MEQRTENDQVRGLAAGPVGRGHVQGEVVDDGHGSALRGVGAGTGCQSAP